MYKVLKEEENFIVIDKIARVPCIRLGDSAGLSDELVLEFPELNKIKDYGFTHRLDNETLGVLLIARNENYYDKIRNLFKEKKIEKSYLAKVYGTVKEKSGVINFPIAHSKNSKKKMIAVKEAYKIYRGKAQSASTKFELLESEPTTSKLRLFTNSGRRHQIRVHLSSIAYPICGDSLYSKNKDYPFLNLIAESIKFTCPLSGELLEFKSTLTFKDLSDL